MAVKKTNKADAPEKGGCLFSKEQLLAAKRFQERRDIVNALLQPSKQYSIAEVEEMIEIYMQSKVK